MMSNIKKFFSSILSILLFTGLVFFTSCGSSGDGGFMPIGPRAPESNFLPVVFVHGFYGNAAQFESQAQRFIANGYPVAYLAVYDHDTSVDLVDNLDVTNAALDEIIDNLLRTTKHTQVNLIAHSRGAGVCTYYLESSPERAARVANYVAVDSQTGLQVIDTLGLTGTPGGVNMLALWGEGDPTREVDGATNVYLPDQAHIQIATSAESFVEMFEFFNGEAPEINDIPIAPGDTVEIAGKVSYFPANTGALGTLEIYELDAETAQRVGPALATYTIGAAGTWGPLNVTKGVYYEFAFEHNAGGKHYFYREPFLADNYFIRLDTSDPTAQGNLGSLMARTENHTDILIKRDKEMWGDQEDGSDILIVDGVDIFDSAGGELAAARTKRLSGLFLMDWGADKANWSSPLNPTNPSNQLTDLSAPIEVPPSGVFHGLPFMSGLDLYMPADEARAISIELTPRGGGGFKQIVNVPAWPSDDVRITVHFRDFVRQANPIVFVHGYAGSASQFESQAQRFMANGYPLTHLKVYENDTSGATSYPVQVGQLNAVIDAVRAATGAAQVDLIGHSRGTFVSQAYLGASPVYAAKVARYVNVDGAGAEALPGGVPTLALWGDGYLLPSGEIVGATNIYRTDQSHIQVATSKESFADMFRFFTGRVPAFTRIPDALDDSIEIAGRAIYFPVNVGARGTLEIYAIDPVTTARLGGALATYELDTGFTEGYWGPLTVDKGATLEFAFEHKDEYGNPQGKHYFYREPLMADNYFIRLNTSDPSDSAALGNLMAKSANHTDILISRDKEMWGNQGANNDSLTVGGTQVMTPEAAARAKHLSGLFLMDWGPDNAEPLGPSNEPDQATDLTTPITTFNALPFMSGLDLYLPTSPADVIPLIMTPRGGGGATQVVNVPNLPSDEIRISVHFRDFVQ